MRLIDADALTVELMDSDLDHLQRDDWKEVIQIVADAPTIEERKMGVWTREDIVLTSNPPQYQWHCSECGFLARGFSPTKLTNYCPNCGADMGGEDYEIS